MFPIDSESKRANAFAQDEGPSIVRPADRSGPPNLPGKGCIRFSPVADLNPLRARGQTKRPRDFSTPHSAMASRAQVVARACLTPSTDPLLDWTKRPLTSVFVISQNESVSTPNIPLSVHCRDGVVFPAGAMRLGRPPRYLLSPPKV